MEKTFRKAHKHLSRLKEGKIKLFSGKRLLDRFYFENITVVDVSPAAQEAIASIEKLLFYILAAKKYWKQKRGRTRADEREIVTAIEGLYEDLGYKPTSYFDGPFFELVCFCLEILGLPSSDPSRAIKQALKNLSKK